MSSPFFRIVFFVFLFKTVAFAGKKQGLKNDGKANKSSPASTSGLLATTLTPEPALAIEQEHGTQDAGAFEVVPSETKSGKSGDRSGVNPDVDPFENNIKWSNFVLRVDAISLQWKELMIGIASLLSETNPEFASSPESYAQQFFTGFSKEYRKVAKFFQPLENEIRDHAPYTILNPAIGLTTLDKLQLWAKEQPTEPLDMDRLKWIEVNGFAITVHNIFDQLLQKVDRWGILEVSDTQTISYPTWTKEAAKNVASNIESFELAKLEELVAKIDVYIKDDSQRHMMRSLEEILRNHLNSWNPESEYNIYCYGNNEYGIVHDTFDLLTDAAMFLSIADMKAATLEIAVAIMNKWIQQSGTLEFGRHEDVDVPQKVESSFGNMEVRVAKKIKISRLLPATNILPGPVIFKCDLPPLVGHQPENEAAGVPSVADGNIPTAIGHPLLASQWGKNASEPLSPIYDGVSSNLDPQSGPYHDLPAGYIDHRNPNFQYASFQGAYSGYLEAEQVLNPDGSCKSTCEDFRRPHQTCENKSIDCPAMRNSYCQPGQNCLENSSCNQIARECIRTSFEVKFCPSKAPGRLYDWISINGTLVGQVTEDAPSSCDVSEAVVQERWEMDFGVILNAPQYCEVCLCKCDGPLNGEGMHFFDIQPLLARPGYVITSVRFQQKDNIVQMLAEEAKLLPDGTVDESTAEWIQPPVPEKSNVEKTLQLGGENGFRQLGLDMVYAPMNAVVTGIKFVLAQETLHLSIVSSEIEIISGELKENTPWITANYPPPAAKTQKLFLQDKMSSVKQKGPSQPFNLPSNDKVVRFDASSLLKEAGQAVIPFFDTQTVRHHAYRKPLAAVGILHKAKAGYGGFLTPALVSYRLPYLQSQT